MIQELSIFMQTYIRSSIGSGSNFIITPTILPIRYPLTSMVTIHFLPNKVTVTATPGEPLLDAAARAGISIPTGCLMGSCFACEVEIEGRENPTRACLTAVPTDPITIVHLYDDPIW
jgi:ferredoxin